MSFESSLQDLDTRTNTAPAEDSNELSKGALSGSIDREALLDSANSNPDGGAEQQLRLNNTRQELESVSRLNPEERGPGAEETLRASASSEREAIVSKALQDGVVSAEETDIINDSLREKDRVSPGMPSDKNPVIVGLAAAPQEISRTLERGTEPSERGVTEDGATRLGALLKFPAAETPRTLERASNDLADGPIEQSPMKFKIAGVMGGYVITGRFEDGVFRGSANYPDGSQTSLTLDSASFKKLGRREELETLTSAA